MSRRFTAQHAANGYAAMGGHRKRPRTKGHSNDSVAESIARERNKAARMSAATKKK